MKILIADAKMLKEQSYPITKQNPLFNEESLCLINKLETLEPRDIHDLMNISFKQSSLIYDYYHNEETYPALSLYHGIVYQQLKVPTYSEDDYLYLSDTLCIMSPLYGVLRYNDAIRYHRLEMKNKLIDCSLYTYWKNKITDYFKDEDYLISLTTNEYLKLVDHPHIIHIDFGDYDGHKIKRSAIYLKKARGKMLNYMIKNHIYSIEEIKKISFEGYLYNESLSSTNTLVFIRNPKLTYTKK